MKKKSRSFMYVVLVIVSVTIMAMATKSDLDITQVFSGLIAVVSVVLLGVELSQSRKISEGDFLAELNQMFVENEDYKTAYTMFEKYDFENCPDLELSNVQISNYLTFFEIFQLLIDRETLSIEMFDDLFGYRFFIAVHNPYVQKQKLAKSPDNFRNLYVLEKKWIECRRKKNLPVFHEEYSLSKVVDEDVYKRIIRSRK